MGASRELIATRLRQAGVWAGVLVGLIGAVVLVGGWWLDVSVFRQPLPPFTSMRAATAAGLIAVGLGVTASGLH